MTAEDDFILTTVETTALEELGKRVSKDLDLKKWNQNHLLYRFLKARDWDVTQAEIMLRKWYEWRKQNNVDTILTDYKPPEILQKYFANFHIGYDKDDCPLFYMPTGKYDSRGLHMSAKYSDIEKAVLQVAETSEHYLEKQSEKLNKRLPGYVYILDMTGLSFANATDKKGIESFIRVIKLQQDNYPERLKAVYLINVSTLFTFPFNILKNFLAPRVLSKFHVHGAEGWKEDILEAVDADTLPKCLGGNRTDPDGNPLCKTILNQGGKIDEKYYIHKSKNSLSNSPSAKKLVLARASFSELPLKIKEPGSFIEWEFETKTRDIGFGLFYKVKEGGEENLLELVPLQRLETEEFSETGMYKCDKSGDYVILFDNSYSWVRSKEIFYQIRVVSPAEYANQLKK